MADQFHIAAITSTTASIIKNVEELEVDVVVKIAALKAAAALYENAVMSQTLARMVENLLIKKD